MRFCIDDTYYEVLIEKKNNKNLYIRITDDFKIKVTCPKLYTKLIINKILEENKISIKKMLDKKKKENINKIKEDNLLLGKSLNVLYEDVKKPLFKDNMLIVKDDIMKDKWYKKKAMELFKIYLDEAYFVFDEDIPYPKLKVRSMKTRWGVCNKKDDSVTLNLELVKKDPVFLNYVIVHELSHFVHFDHSKAFWSTVEKYCPDYKNVRKKLKE